MSERDMLGDATAALALLLGEDLTAASSDLADLQRRLQLASVAETTRCEWAASSTHDLDAKIRHRRWGKAIEAAWELARHEIEVARGRRRAGVVA